MLIFLWLLLSVPLSPSSAPPSRFRAVARVLPRDAATGAREPPVNCADAHREHGAKERVEARCGRSAGAATHAATGALESARSSHANRLAGAVGGRETAAALELTALI